MTEDRAECPVRRKLPHEVPGWVPDGSRYFITICCKERATNSLAISDVAESLLNSVSIRENLNQWYVYIMMIMPDHLHLIARFGKGNGVERTIQSLKRYHAREDGIVWQSGFFEHRLRSESEFTDKFYYVLRNPVRKQLVADPKEWPYCFCRGKW